MTRTENLAPLLDLPRAELEIVADSNYRVFRNTSAVAALGIVLEDARPYDEPGWVTFSDNVIDLLPGETRQIELGGPVGALIVEGWNARA
jgi:beta-mannosidase